MAKFLKAQFHQIQLGESSNEATVNFKARGQTVSVTINLPNLNALVAGGINTLRSAEQRSTQFPEFKLTEPVSIDHMIPLPVDQWRVSKSEAMPGQVILHLLAAGGLYLTYTLGETAIRSLEESLRSAMGTAPSSSAKPGTH